MAKLEEYTSLEEKEENFSESTTINTKEDFDNFLMNEKKCSSNNDGVIPKTIYRGMSEARFKIYTSSQRLWIEQDLDDIGEYWHKQRFSKYSFTSKVENSFAYYHSFIQALINNARKVSDGLLSKHYTQYCNNDNTLIDFSVLSFLQHKNECTPLLDFSANSLISLFFGCRNSTSSFTKGDINNYFSIIKANISPISNSTIDEQVRSTKENTLEQLKKYKENNPDKLHELDIPDFEYLFFSTNQLTFMTPDTAFHWRTLNATAQEGVHLFHNSPTQPLEEYITKNSTYKIKLSCFNINKSLIPYILRKLLQEGISQESLFPDEISIAKKSLEKTIFHP